MTKCFCITKCFARRCDTLVSLEIENLNCCICDCNLDLGHFRNKKQFFFRLKVRFVKSKVIRGNVYNKCGY